MSRENSRQRLRVEAQCRRPNGFSSGLYLDGGEFDGAYVAWDGQRFTISGPRGMRHGGALP